jgi:hypothetical protein
MFSVLDAACPAAASSVEGNSAPDSADVIMLTADDSSAAAAAAAAAAVAAAAAAYLFALLQLQVWKATVYLTPLLGGYLADAGAAVAGWNHQHNSYKQLQYLYNYPAHIQLLLLEEEDKMNRLKFIHTGNK